MTLSSGSVGATTSAPVGGGIGVNNTTGALVVPNDGLTSLTGGLGGTVAATGTVYATISAPNLPGGVQATASVLVTGGSVTGYTITNAGSGYDTLALISLSSSGSGVTLPSNPTVGTYVIAGAPYVMSEGIVNNGSTPTLNTFTGGSATLTTSSSVTLAATRGIQIDAGGATFDVSNYSGGFTATVNGPISGVGALTKTDGGELVLTASNSYQAGTIIAGGTLQAGNTYALGATTGNLAVNAGTLDLFGNSIAVGALSGSSGALITNSSSTSGTLTSNSSANSVYGGNIQDGTTGKVGLTKAGSGLLTLTGNNTYTGTTNINGGVLAPISTLSANTNITFGGGTLKLIGGYTDYSSQIVNSGSAISIDTGNQTVAFGTPLAASNTGGLTVLSSSGNGVLQLSGSQGFTGPTTITSGALQLGINVNLSDAILNSSSVLDNSSLVFENYASQNPGFAISGTGSVSAQGSGLLILSQSNSYSGGTLISNNATLNFSNINGLGTGPVTFGGAGTLQAGVSGTLGNNIGANSGVTGIFDTQSNNVTTTGALFGSGNLTKIGSGILTLNGSASNTGTLFLNAGTVNLGSTNALSTRLAPSPSEAARCNTARPMPAIIPR